MTTDPWQDASDVFSRLTDGPGDPMYPMCGGAGEYYECHQAQERSQLLLNAVERVLEVLTTPDFQFIPAPELADRISTVIAEELGRPLDS